MPPTTTRETHRCHQCNHTARALVFKNKAEDESGEKGEKKKSEESLHGSKTGFQAHQTNPE